MLVAHLVPGYFAAVWSRTYWNPAWSRGQRAGLWIAALASTALPDTDVMYNVLFRGFFGHTTLWTHSIFVHLSILLVWLALRLGRRRPYGTMFVGLVAAGGLSHLLLDVISHGTPLFYPLSVRLVGAPSDRVLHGKLWGYLTDPIVLLEPFLLILVFTRRITAYPRLSIVQKNFLLAGLFTGVALAAMAFLCLLPKLQRMVGF